MKLIIAITASLFAITSQAANISFFADHQSKTAYAFKVVLTADNMDIVDQGMDYAPNNSTEDLLVEMEELIAGQSPSQLFANPSYAACYNGSLEEAYDIAAPVFSAVQMNNEMCGGVLEVERPTYKQIISSCKVRCPQITE